jgi:gamma-glutamyltranspeptidase/glutathione hydrolase
MGFLEAATGGRPVGVPGAMRMLEAAHRAHGTLPWAALFADSIAAAEAGFPVSPRLAAALWDWSARLRADPGARGLFFAAAAPPGGAEASPAAEGQVLRNPALAATLRALAGQGAEALHRGPIAAGIAASVRGHPTNPGLMTTDDLAGYAPVRRAPVCGPYRAVLVCGFPPPSSGGVAVAQVLALVEHQDMAGLDPRGADHAHRLGEAGRIAFADRNRYLADSDHVPVPLRGLLEPAYLTLRAQMIDPLRALPVTQLRAGNPSWRGALGPGGPGRPATAAPQAPQPEGGTAHLSVVDGAGNVLAMTTTVEMAFGAGMVVGGMVLNNQLTDFSFLPERDGRPVANRVEPGKRPRSSMSPTIVLDAAGAEPLLALGSAGGSRIIGHVAQTLVALIDHGLDPQAAVSLPRIGAVDERVELESGTSAAALAPVLEQRGFPVQVRPNTSGLQVIRVLRTPDGARLLAGGADPRREGVALGD